MAVGIRVWDLPTRLFHWLLVALVAFSWWSAENREMEWHLRSGMVLLGLIAFRLIWGMIGGSTARFGGFVHAPRRVLAYLRGDNGHDAAGHNPLGGYSVLVMLVLLVAQVTTGLFATDVDGLESGPLSFLISFDLGRASAEVHEASFNLLLGVIAVHVLAILFYLVVRRRNLIRPMVTGRDTALAPATPALRPAGLPRFVIAAGLSLALAWAVSKGFWM